MFNIQVKFDLSVLSTYTFVLKSKTKKDFNFYKCKLFCWFFSVVLLAYVANFQKLLLNSMVQQTNKKIIIWSYQRKEFCDHPLQMLPLFFQAI